ncbi:MAG: TlpA family protein disulfide reductase [Proteobacteria bacterium]|nr:TlpA family protein disulfide reductase [Pseudomonadota bacterium]
MPNRVPLGLLLRIGVTLCVSLALTACASVQPEGDVVPVSVSTPPRDGKVVVGDPYRDFGAPELMGGTVRLSDLVGRKVVLLQFWGIRCAPCLAEMEFLTRLQVKHQDRGLQVVGVNTDRATPAQLTEALVSRKIEPAFPHVLDPDFAISKHYTRWLIPVAVLIDRSGVVRAIHTGYKPELEGTIEAEVEALLGRQ